MTMPAGKYWIGDLCYVMQDKWDAFCETTIAGNDCLSGEFKVGEILVASYGTMYGDGEYHDGNGRKYPVDAGLIGCILVSDIDMNDADNVRDMAYGHVVDFPTDFDTGSNDGRIYFGRLVAIDTSDQEEDDDSWPEQEEEEEEEPEIEDRCAED